ncbi:Uncharacterized protein Adt_13216 [Abeliophyllum distichum]|uniref:Reverse transcriptase domain-containing protein n=1 Tax=Abeliophyllum distichum TaxID=126358 RepID=A0ABD1TW59_9LAMI
MYVPREFPILLEQVYLIFDNDPHDSSRLNCHKNVEALIPKDAASSTQLEVNQPEHFRRNSSDDLASLDEWILSITSASGEVFESPKTIQPLAVSFFQKLLSAPPQSVDPIRPEDVFQAVLDFFAGGHLPMDFAATSNVLLLKWENACRWSEFRPVILCTVFNKLIKKLMNLRLIRSSQFLRADSSQDGLLEIMSSLYRSYYIHLIRKYEGGNVILKLDMAKAYDRTDWAS